MKVKAATMTELDESRLVDAIASRVIKAIEGRGLGPQRFETLMSTAEVAKTKGCSTYTVRRNWQSWGLQLMGRGAAGSMQFSGVSVHRHLERENQ